ncbi:hypothetical protein AVT_03510 [Bacillus tropicus]|uniref:Uncharacterized protein n=1 Tax=Bacillus shihchuchen TaxID=3036942 RepID=A0ABT7KVK9_9BACI|nr:MULTISPECIES: hypothetical protein [Bacillus]MDA2167406.1 hypothetical protein [Bacillus cereus]MDL2418192.1 hypothetical protein [Bacillus shihchuchen]MDA2778032.1 hypothetical protein [Bacillus cereus group sp. Bc002]MDP7989428.1 hypothetical protein [Bacillus sp. MHSD_36]MDQ7236319.1 hypothetical protein [Bacillus pacificus]
MECLINGVCEINQLISKTKRKTMSKYNNRKVNVQKSDEYKVKQNSYLGERANEYGMN